MHTTIEHTFVSAVLHISVWPFWRNKTNRQPVNNNTGSYSSYIKKIIHSIQWLMWNCQPINDVCSVTGFYGIFQLFSYKLFVYDSYCFFIWVKLVYVQTSNIQITRSSNGVKIEIKFDFWTFDSKLFRFKRKLILSFRSNII